ncbi:MULTISPECIES: hypothetical protein [unclassified Thermosipho (in: thermotogales)]|uniref:hypothetical protein n=1 Tax=unclassified Thermosipho (in: thermotogales) TaxID=2676525 RepID=UPI000984D815|nr:MULTISPECIES: hypothetical protein [unclassified Thermosipho (in: thermotogales)]MBT1247319.1 hypothetical protein [Thermosipho sp. 1244]OOC46922.1 hypothetical protein XO09_03955 [Thermosipho sp. 1223]
MFDEDLIKIKDLKNFRASCYSTGMYTSLLLDQITTNWKINYTTSKKYLYNFLLDIVKYQPSDLKDLLAYEQTKKLAQILIQKCRNDITKALETFEKNNGYKIVLEGEFNLSGFDPMNILKKDNLLLHKTFLKIKFKEKELFIKGPAVSKMDNNVWKYKKIIFFSNQKPKIVRGNTIEIDDVIKIEGTLYENKAGFFHKNSV